MQIEHAIALCSEKFSDLIAIPIAAQFMADNLIALFQVEETENGLAVAAEKHYRLVRADALSSEEIQNYRLRPL